MDGLNRWKYYEKYHGQKVLFQQIEFKESYMQKVFHIQCVLKRNGKIRIKFVYSKKATKFEKNPPSLIWNYLATSRKMGWFPQIFLAFSGFMNFT